MAKNKHGMPQLDANQIVRREHDPDHDAKRIVFAVPLQLDISLSHQEGDSVSAHLPSLALKGDTSKTEVIPPTACIGIKTVAVYGSSKAHIQFSPSDADDFWLYLEGNNLCARRIKVIIETPDETPSTVYLVGQG